MTASIASSLHPLPPQGSPGRTPKILLAGQHQPSLLKRMEGWSRRAGRPSAFLIQFLPAGGALTHFARDSFDLAIVEAPSAEHLAEQVQQLVRVARQGLIVRR